MLSQIKNNDSADEVTALRALFEEYLKCAFWSEQILESAFTDLRETVASQDIKKILTEHVAATRIHGDRLEKIFESIGIPPEGQKFDAIACLIEKFDIVIGQTQSGPVRDAAIIALVQHIVHCEIASYGTLKSFAITLKEENVVSLLEQNLSDEKDIDQKLSAVAEAYINDEAANKEY